MAGEFFSFWDLENRLKKQVPSRFYAFFGENEFLHRKAISRLRSAVVQDPASSLNYFSADPDDATFPQFVQEARSLPMLGGTKFCLYRASEKIPRDCVPHIEKYIQKPPRFTVMVLDFSPSFNPFSKDDCRNPAFRAVEPAQDKFVFKKLDEKRVCDFLNTVAEEEGFHVDRAAFPPFVQKLGGDLGACVRELEKAFLLCGEARRVSARDLADVTSKLPSFNVFEMLDSLAARSLPDSLKKLEALLDAGENALGLLVMIGRFFKQALAYHELKSARASEGDILDRMNAAPLNMRMQAFHLKNLQKAHCNYTGHDLRQGLEWVGKTEEEIKSVRVDPSDHMRFLVLRLCRSAAGPADVHT